MLEEEKDSVVGGLKIITEGILRAVLKEEIYPMRAQVSGSLEIITTPLPFLFFFISWTAVLKEGIYSVAEQVSGSLKIVANEF